MKAWLKQKKGFSFIELIVVIAIVAIGAALSWSTLVTSRKRTQVNNACESVATMVNNARAYALAGLPGITHLQARCDGGAINSCRIIKLSSGATPQWTVVSGGTLSKDSDLLRGVNIVDFVRQYPIPYAATSAVNQNVTIGTAPITRTLTIDPFKAVCR